MPVLDFVSENPIQAAVAWILWGGVSWAAFFLADNAYRKNDTGARAPKWFHTATAVVLSFAWPALALLTVLGAMTRSSPDWLLDKALIVLFPWWVSEDSPDP